MGYTGKLCACVRHWPYHGDGTCVSVLISVVYREAPSDRSAGHFHPFTMQNVSQNFKESLNHGQIFAGNVQ